MIAAVEGLNRSGRSLDVRRIIDESSPASADVWKPNFDANASPATILLLCSGPYTVSRNLKYEALEVVLRLAVRSNPDVVVLLGSFVDDAHMNMTDAIPVDFDSLFRTRVLGQISNATEAMPGTTFVLVPALRDVMMQNVAPQRQWNPGVIHSPERVHFAPKPISVRSGARTRAAVLAISTLPALHDISAQCICYNCENRLGSIFSHMIHQW